MSDFKHSGESAKNKCKDLQYIRLQARMIFPEYFYFWLCGRLSTIHHNSTWDVGFFFFLFFPPPDSWTRAHSHSWTVTAHYLLHWNEHTVFNNLLKTYFCTYLFYCKTNIQSTIEYIYRYSYISNYISTVHKCLSCFLIPQICSLSFCTFFNVNCTISYITKV